MGYYSQVAITMYEDDLIKLVRSAKANSPNDAYSLIKCAKVFTDALSRNVVTLYWENVKWYIGYIDVDFVEDFLRSGIRYVFRRAGEEHGDVEEEYSDGDGYLSDYAGIIQYIEIDGTEQREGYIDELAAQIPDNISDEEAPK